MSMEFNNKKSRLVFMDNLGFVTFPFSSYSF